MPVAGEQLSTPVLDYGERAITGVLQFAALQITTGEVHGYLATPTYGKMVENDTLAARNAARPIKKPPENVRKLLRQRMGFGPIPWIRYLPHCTPWVIVFTRSTFAPGSVPSVPVRVQALVSLT
jgi:hypothetical protein